MAAKDREAQQLADRLALTPRTARALLRDGRLPVDVAGAELEQYTTDRAAEILGVTPYTVRRWTREGRLGGTKLGRNTVRVSRADREAFLEARRVKGEQERGDG